MEEQHSALVTHRSEDRAQLYMVPSQEVILPCGKCLINHVPYGMSSLRARTWCLHSHGVPGVGSISIVP